ncbi:hypothetical protein QYH69_34250 [Paraburkholderia sp. SARCC-3016]|nr:hypothetical protein [Paraburkholderia sp. SARCC-3016]MDQ7982289.1 hypothetical protein [Paraburkholderia sp. SARCC-3016]
MLTVRPSSGWTLIPASSERGCRCPMYTDRTTAAIMPISCPMPNPPPSFTKSACRLSLSDVCGTGGGTRGSNPTTTTFGYDRNDATIYAGNDLVIAAGQINNTFGNLLAGHGIVIGGVGSTVSSTTPALEVSRIAHALALKSPLIFCQACSCAWPTLAPI